MTDDHSFVLYDFFTAGDHQRLLSPLAEYRRNPSEATWSVLLAAVKERALDLEITDEASEALTAAVAAVGAELGYSHLSPLMETTPVELAKGFKQLAVTARRIGWSEFSAEMLDVAERFKRSVQ